jgi:hypothetical protein
MMYAESRSDCEAASSRFQAEYEAKYPKAVQSLVTNWERLMVPCCSLAPLQGRPIRSRQI